MRESNSLLRETNSLLVNPRPGLFQKWNNTVIKVSKNYAMCAIDSYNKLKHTVLSYSIVSGNYATTML